MQSVAELNELHVSTFILIDCLQHGSHHNKHKWFSVESNLDREQHQTFPNSTSISLTSREYEKLAFDQCTGTLRLHCKSFIMPLCSKVSPIFTPP